MGINFIYYHHAVGATVGDVDGAAVGATVGAGVGAKAHSAAHWFPAAKATAQEGVNSPVTGWRPHAPDTNAAQSGTTVGESVGAIVGDADGLVVGAVVGGGVHTPAPSHRPPTQNVPCGRPTQIISLLTSLHSVHSVQPSFPPVVSHVPVTQVPTVHAAPPTVQTPPLS